MRSSGLVLAQLFLLVSATSSLRGIFISSDWVFDHNDFVAWVFSFILLNIYFYWPFFVDLLLILLNVNCFLLLLIYNYVVQHLWEYQDVRKANIKILFKIVYDGNSSGMPTVLFKQGKLLNLSISDNVVQFIRSMSN